MNAKGFFNIIEQGIEVWNKWMEENPEEIVDLSLSNFEGDNLSRIDLSGTNLEFTTFKNSVLRNTQLSHAELNEANLINADLRDADLTKAKLRGTKLHNTNLSKANLSGADLSHNLSTTSMDTGDKIVSYNTELVDTNLSGANLTGANLSGTDLTRVNLKDANLKGANLTDTDLREVDLRGTRLSGVSLINANLTGANLRGVDLSNANLTGANLSKTNLEGALLDNANLSGTYLCRTNLVEANLSGCRIYGISAWGVELERTVQSNLIITDDSEPEITVDNLEVAQFIYLLLNNQKIRGVINTITSKVVLILGRFTEERKSVLDALRNELRKHNFSPVVFDFDPSAKRDLTETISLLGRMSRFVIADLTDAKSIPQELESIVPYLPSVPVQPILQTGKREYAMFEHYKRYPWVLPIYHYQDVPNLLASIKEHIIKPVEEKGKDKTKDLEEENKKLREENKRLKGGK